MFWKNLCALCNAHNTTPNTVCKALGLSSATSTHWKQGAVPRDTTLQKVAEYFGVTVEDLLRDPAEKPEPAPTASDDSLLDARFYELLDKLTLKELRKLKADLEEITKDRK